MAFLLALAVLPVRLVPARATGEEENFFTLGAITVGLPWARAAAAGSDTLAFFKLDNAGDADTLVSASAEIAYAIEVVGLVNRDGAISTVPIGPMELPAGRMLFDPGGLALALRGLTRALDTGDSFELTIMFAKAGALTVEVGVEPARAMLSSEDH